MKQIAIIHTSFVSVDDLRKLCSEIIPGVKVWNIVDDSLLQDVLSAGGLTEGVTRRICAYAVEAEARGADLILNQCSSVGEAVDVARRILNVPFIKIDEPMAAESVRLGSRISVIATVPTTLGPSARLIEAMAAKAGRNASIRQCLCKGAFDALVKEGDKEKHNSIVLEKIREESEKSDVVVLAQGSMVALLPCLKDIRKPILTSPRMGIQGVRDFLEKSESKKK
ncbi:MAG: aspartate/glutamate racemase family protein [Victivallales bacterium]